MPCCLAMAVLIPMAFQATPNGTMYSFPSGPRPVSSTFLGIWLTSIFPACTSGSRSAIVPFVV